MDEDCVEMLNFFLTSDAQNFVLDSISWKKDSVGNGNDENTPVEDEDARDIRNLFDGLNTEVEDIDDDDDDGTTSDESEGESLSHRDATKISDEEIKNLRVKELNKLLRNVPWDEAIKIRKRRRNLKNRGYALNCRLKKQQAYEDLLNENAKLRKQLEGGKWKLLKIWNEKEEYKKKYAAAEQAFTSLQAGSAGNIA